MNIPIKKYLNLLSEYLKPQVKQVLVLTLLLAGLIALQLINPQILRYFIDEAAKGDASQNLTIAAVIFLQC